MKISSWHLVPVPAVYRVRSGLVAERTAQLNRLRSLLAEFGLIALRGRHALMERLPVLLANETLPGVARNLFERQSTRIRQLGTQRLLQRMP